MELPSIGSSPPPKARERRSFQLNHFNNKVFYSIDEKLPISRTHIIQRSHCSNSLKISKSLIKIRSKQRQHESLTNKLEQRMKVRRAINLQRIYEDNTRMFARIYTQKSEYRYNKVSQLIKKPHKLFKQNLNVTESSDLKQSKMKLMRQKCCTKQRIKFGYLREGLKSIALNEVSRLEDIKFQKSQEMD